MNKKALIAEFIGTFALIFVGVGSIAAEMITAGKVGLVGIALAHGLTIAVMVSATAAVSGGHLNPAVTLAMLVTKNIDGKNAAGYVLAQCLGSIAAAGLLIVCLPGVVLDNIKMGVPAPGPAMSLDAVVLLEMILTFFLVFVVFGTAVDKRAPKVGGLFIGLTVALDILIGGPLTGAAMNPARHLGPALLGGGLQHLWIYWIGPVAGAVLAATVYKNLLMEKQ